MSIWKKLFGNNESQASSDSASKSSVVQACNEFGCKQTRTAFSSFCAEHHKQNLDGKILRLKGETEQPVRVNVTPAKSEVHDEYTKMLSCVYGLTFSHEGWTYLGRIIEGASVYQSKNPDTWVAFMMMQIISIERETKTELKGICVVEGNPPLIVFAFEKSHFCFPTSLVGDDLGIFAVALCKEWGGTVNSENPGHHGCWLLEKKQGLTSAQMKEVVMHASLGLDNNLETIKALLKADPNFVFNRIDGKTPLHFAALFGNRALAELLLTNNADVNAKDTSGATPLHLAAIGGHKDVAVVLLANKSDTNATANNGYTPLRAAAANQKDDVVSLLRQFDCHE